MKKRVISTLLALIFVIGILPMASALAAGEFSDYQRDVLEYSNKYHNGTELVLDARLCAMAAVLAVEQDGRSKMTAYRPDGQYWATIFEEYGYSAIRASSGCNWMRSKSKPTAKQIVEYWMETPGFKENVRSAMYSHTGVYMHYSTKRKCYYIVQLFTKPSSGQAAGFPLLAEAVATGNVNVRSGPGTSYSRIGKLKKAQIISVVSVSGDWAEIVMPQDRKGYVHKAYISFVCSPAATSQIDVPSTDPGSVGAAIATGNVNVRQGPGTNYKKIGKLRRGQTIAVWSINGKWAEITWTGSQNGYVHTDYIKFEEGSNGATIDAHADGKYLYATEPVNMRTGPGTKYAIITKLQTGEKVKLAGRSGKWTKVLWNGRTGYVFSKYLSAAKAQQSLDMAFALEESGFFTTHANIFLGTYLDKNNVLVIRVTNGTDTEKITSDLKPILAGRNGAYKVVNSAMPSYVNKAYIKTVMETIASRYESLSESDKALCGWASSYYNIEKDEFIVGIVDMTDAKIRCFKMWLYNWDCITFESVDEIAVPMA